MALFPTATDELELWAGVECTVNRVGERWFDQVRASGHEDRLDDIDRIAALGVTRVRFPVLWERVMRRGSGPPDWRWSDERIERLARLGVAPIIGLLHHGSGPAGTDLCDAGFVERLAAFADAVARRYPWVQQWTPINEPLTTARFSALYGHWYPHARDIGTCLRALVGQVSAVAAAMARIRAVIPGAQLIQTEDLGRVSGTPELDYQVNYENERRWLGFDLLAGRVDARHPLRRHCEENGVDLRALDALVDHPCVPDVIGLNYYLTSDRFLDHRIDRYPPHVIGGNRRQSYADVESVRVAGVGIAGHLALIEETWARYEQPIALTEVHLGCTREEQLRWLAEAWDAAQQARRDGVDLRALTLWSVFGAFDWHCLVTRNEGRYEPGVFDVRAPAPRATAIAAMACELARHGRSAHPMLASRGWWQSSNGRPCHGAERSPGRRARPLMIAGVGTLGDRLAARCDARGIPWVRSVDTDRRDEATAWDRAPWAVVAIHGASLRGSSVDDQASLLQVASACNRSSIPLVAFSNDEVFQPAEARAHRESDLPLPATEHGRARVRLERALLVAAPNSLLVRVGVLLDADDPDDPVARLLAVLHEGGQVRAPDDVVVSISHVSDLLDATLDLLIDGERGIWHGSNVGSVSLLELATAAAGYAGIDVGRLLPSSGPCDWISGCPAGTRVLVSERAWPMPSVETALPSYSRFRIRARVGTSAA